jgi:hypothetical protein
MEHRHHQKDHDVLVKWSPNITHQTRGTVNLAGPAALARTDRGEESGRMRTSTRTRYAGYRFPAEIIGLPTTADHRMRRLHKFLHEIGSQGRDPSRAAGECSRLSKPARVVAACRSGANRRADVRASGVSGRLQPVCFRSNPNRYRSFAGAAKAAERQGDRARAKSYYQKLVSLTDSADTMRPDIVAAKQDLAQN